ncbi:hypothetical protein OJAV_G00224010 [Oryzias javanicus]|uniref:Uncharacterized protein n=1 Tax=Oryzias javanicus TaxID=123683 RepID=A0A3S2TW37_ORYJA|nr:hypothetical protein OJAV_G00224010 [Oryzias javanicus]
MPPPQHTQSQSAASTPAHHLPFQQLPQPAASMADLRPEALIQCQQIVKVFMLDNAVTDAWRPSSARRPPITTSTAPSATTRSVSPPRPPPSARQTATTAAPTNRLSLPRLHLTTTPISIYPQTPDSVYIGPQAALRA